MEIIAGKIQNVLLVSVLISHKDLTFVSHLISEKSLKSLTCKINTDKADSINFFVSMALIQLLPQHIQFIEDVP